MYRVAYINAHLFVPCRLNTIFVSCQSLATGSMNRPDSTSGTPAMPHSLLRKLILNWQQNSLRFVTLYMYIYTCRRPA